MSRFEVRGLEVEEMRVGVRISIRCEETIGGGARKWLNGCSLDGRELFDMFTTGYRLSAGNAPT
jgi:hypothetical protein